MIRKYWGCGQLCVANDDERGSSFLGENVLFSNGFSQILEKMTDTVDGV
jgi:hypothetical protein